jgi:endo-1,4-beta-xylanase
MKIGILSLAVLLAFAAACEKIDFSAGPKPSYDPAAATEALKDVASFPIGVAVSHGNFLGNTSYQNVVKRDFSEVTLENEMKNGSIVRGDGSFDFSRADEMVNFAQANGLQVFGHTLVWHSQQAADYYKSVAGIVVQAPDNIIANGGFEEGSGNSFAHWTVFNSGNPPGTSVFSAGSGPNEVRSGNRSLKVENPVGYPGSQWRVQLASDLTPTAVGKRYIASYWVKAVSPNGSIRLSTQPNPLYQGDQTIGVSWQQITWTITANESETRFLLDMGQAANTYYIDDFSVTEEVTPPSSDGIAAILDEKLKEYITAAATRYRGKVHGWDVVNELFADNGAIRNNSNTPDGPGILVWSNYLGRDFGLKAFQYAAAADPNALLFINDYNLETSAAKLDSLIAYVNEIKSKGAKVDGIGTQMHLNWNTPYAGIEQMFKKLAATGLKIRISELDVRVNPGNLPSLKLTPEFASYQADMYHFVVSSYLRHIPEAQRAGIAVWGVSDQNSWRYNNGTDFPLLYDNNFAKKPAYAGFLQALKRQQK